MLADCVLERQSKPGGESDIWCPERARKLEKERVEAKMGLGCVSCQEKEAARLFPGMEARPRPRFQRLRARGGS